jgi:hypothetical protein
MEKGQTLKATNTSTPTGGAKILDTTHIMFVLVDYPSTTNVLNDFGVFYACGTLPSSPIYLQNLSLLC